MKLFRCHGVEVSIEVKIQTQKHLLRLVCHKGLNDTPKIHPSLRKHALSCVNDMSKKKCGGNNTKIFTIRDENLIFQRCKLCQQFLMLPCFPRYLHCRPDFRHRNKWRQVSEWWFSTKQSFNHFTRCLILMTFFVFSPEIFYCAECEANLELSLLGRWALGYCWVSGKMRICKEVADVVLWILFFFKKAWNGLIEIKMKFKKLQFLLKWEFGGQIMDYGLWFWKQEESRG